MCLDVGVDGFRRATVAGQDASSAAVATLFGPFDHSRTLTELVSPFHPFQSFRTAAFEITSECPVRVEIGRCDGYPIQQKRGSAGACLGILRRLFGRKYIPSWELPDEPHESAELDMERVRGFRTDTATVVIYDLESLKHRLDDEVDWWADPETEIAELRQRNLLIAGLESDGFYDLDLVEDAQISPCYSLRFPSGRIFIGPGEVLTGGGDEPDECCGGVFLDVAPGDYKVAVSRSDDKVRISLVQSVAFENDVSEPVRV